MVAVGQMGTRIDDWHAWGGLDELRPAQWGPPGRLVVVTAHPGDEVLGLGGTIQQLIGSGHQVDVVALAEDEPATVTVARLAEEMINASWCVAPWRGDGDADHERAAAIARKAARYAGVPVADYLVHTWSWAVPGDDRVPWRQARRSAFDQRALARKEAALATVAGTGARRHLAPEVRAKLLRSFEVVLQPGDRITRRT